MKFSLSLVAPFLLLAIAPNDAHADNGYAERYAASTDLRDFVDQRASSPLDGSFFYAYWARWECFDEGGIARRIANDAPPAPGSAQGEAIRVELERCRSLPPELSDVSFQRDDVLVGRV